jgi:hypothetical protein
MDELTTRNEAIARRNASARTARRITLGTAAAATAGVGVVAGVVATPRSVSHTGSARQLLADTPAKTATVAAVPQPAATVPAATTQSPTATPAQPQAAPTAAPTSQPVAVSGGS